MRAKAGIQFSFLQKSRLDSGMRRNDKTATYFFSTHYDLRLGADFFRAPCLITAVIKSVTPAKAGVHSQ